MNIRKISFASLILALSSVGLGASIDHIMNYTPEYDANPAQQGAINIGSTVNYNPAGLMRLENGTYINGGIQVAVGNQDMKVYGKDYKSKHASPVPNFAIYNKNDKRAYFWTIGGIAGGAGLEYKDGIAAYQILGSLGGGLLGKPGSGSKAEGSNQYVQSSLGGAFNITDKLSMSLAGRVVYGQRNFKGTLEIENGSGLLEGKTAKIDAEREAWGFGGQIGLNYAATDRLNIGLRYDTKIKMKFKTDSDESFISFAGKDIGFSTLYPEYKDGAKGYRDLPAILALGAQYKVTDSWTVFAGGNYYFNKDADLGEAFSKPNDAASELSKKYDNGWEIAAGSEYWFTPKAAWLVGVNYAKTGASAKNYRDSEYALDSWMFGTGIKYKYSENLELIGSVAHYLYTSETATASVSLLPGLSTSTDVKYKKGLTAVGAGFSYKF